MVGTAHGYSVLTHEELIDLTWKNLLRPTIQKRFPQTTAADLDKAHAFAYGGCVIQDLGYYPFSSELFSDLTHYVRSGDFVAICCGMPGAPMNLRSRWAPCRISHFPSSRRNMAGG
jgi:hypothetical protein